LPGVPASVPEDTADEVRRAVENARLIFKAWSRPHEAADLDELFNPVK